MKLVKVAYVLIGLLAIAALFLTLGHKDSRVFPSANSYEPGGTAAFAELLRKEGYRVRVATQIQDTLKPSDIAILFDIDKPQQILFGKDERISKLARDKIVRHFKAGGRALILAVPTELNPKRTQEDQAVYQFFPKKAVKENLKLLPYTHTGELHLFPLGSCIELFNAVGDNDSPIVLNKYWKGAAAVWQDGSAATNRFIDRADNAVILSRCIKMIARQDSQIVFYEASFGNIESPSLVNLIGPWAEAGWRQCWILFILIILTLGVRFGLSRNERVLQKGARDLLDAVAMTYERSKATDLALESLYADLDHRVRHALRLPAHAPRKMRDEKLPESLVFAFDELEYKIGLNVPASSALESVQKLEMEVNAFLGTRIKK